MKILFLLPPSEGKNGGGEDVAEKTTFSFIKPYDIAIQATEKDLKCSGNRYEEAIVLNTSIKDTPRMKAIERYTGVMYNALGYATLDAKSQTYFDTHFLIFSGMYGIVKPIDIIGNYKLPIETKGLYLYWKEKITDTLGQEKADIIVDLLPQSYAKMIDWKALSAHIVRVNFTTFKDKKVVKLTHGVKKVKGEYMRHICEKDISRLEDIFGTHTSISENETHIEVRC